MRRPFLRPGPPPDRLPRLRHGLRAGLGAAQPRGHRRRGEGRAQGTQGRVRAREGRRPPTPPEAEVEETLPDIEDGDEEIAAEEDETFLHVEEEEGGDVTNIIGGPVAEGEEER